MQAGSGFQRGFVFPLPGGFSLGPLLQSHTSTLSSYTAQGQEEQMGLGRSGGIFTTC